MTSPTACIAGPGFLVGRVSVRKPRKVMTPALPHRPSSSVRNPSQMVRHLAAARRRRESDDLRQRAVWAEQARHTPTLQSWIDTGDPLEPTLRGPARIALALVRQR